MPPDVRPRQEGVPAQVPRLREKEERDPRAEPQHEALEVHRLHHRLPQRPRVHLHQGHEPPPPGPLRNARPGGHPRLSSVRHREAVLPLPDFRLEAKTLQQPGGQGPAPQAPGDPHRPQGGLR